MASNFSANQYDREFTAKRLQNWEVPHWYPKHPRQRTLPTKIIANDRGHLLPDVPSPKSCAWGNYLSTWQLPKRITKEEAFQINAPPVGGSRWSLPAPKLWDVRQEKQKKPEEPVKIKIEVKEEETKFKSPEIVEKQTPKREFEGKSKLNNPIAISQQKREIRHETLERDHDEH